MSRLEKIVFVFLSASLFFSENTGRAFLYSCCLISVFEQKRFFLFCGVISVLFDIYHSAFVGISFLSIAVVVLIIKKFKSILANLSTWARLYYLFMILCGAELVSCLFIVLLNGRLHLYSHLLVVMKSVFFCYVFESLRKHAKRS